MLFSQARRESLIAKANELQAKHPSGWPYYKAVRGSAACDLPPASDARWDGLRSMPILILCHGEDEVHPISSGNALAQLLPHARLEICENESSAKETFPAIVSSWLHGVLTSPDEQIIR